MSRQQTSELLTRLRRHYIKPGPIPGGIYLEECGLNGTTGSRVDALYVGFTTTSGRLLVGHEVKTSRADWRRELDQAGKADLWADACHQWLIVAPGPEVVPREEIPHGWGLMYPSARTRTRMDIVVKPTSHPDRQPSWQVVRSIMARLDTLQTQRISELRRTIQEEEQAKALEVARATVEREGRDLLTSEQAQKLGIITSIEHVLGPDLPIADWWNDGGVPPETLVAAVAVARAAHVARGGRRYDHVAEGIRQRVATLTAGADALDAAYTLLDEVLGGNVHG